LVRSIQFSFKLGNTKKLRLGLGVPLCYHYVHRGVVSTLHKYKEGQTNAWTPLIFYHFVIGFVLMHLLFLCLATPTCCSTYFFLSLSYHTLLLCLVASYYFILMFHLAIVPCCCQTLKFFSKFFLKKKLGLGITNLKFSFPSLVSFSCFILFFWKTSYLWNCSFCVCVCVHIYFHHIHYTFAFISWCIKLSNFVNDCQGF
jgi:hypothetical protein